MPLSKKKLKKSLSLGSPAPKEAPKPIQMKRTRMDELKAAFNFFDRNHDGNIEADELGTVMASLGYQATDAELQEMINEADLDGNNVIDFEEFVQLMKAKSKKDRDQEHELREAFKVFDCDGNGFISKEELAQVMKSIGEELSDEDLNEMINEADQNGDGVIDFQEFSQMLWKSELVPAQTHV